jgi:hypothetical protein
MLQLEERKRWLVLHCLVGVALLGTAAWSSTRSEYDITFGSDGVLAGGGGDGDGWYYYKNSDEYIMWFYNQPYDPTRRGAMDVWVYLEPVSSNKISSVAVSYGWSTAEWSALGKGHPPMPADTGNTSSSSYIQSVSLYQEDNFYLGESVEPHTTDQVSYNPDWLCMIVKGKNIHIYRFIIHDCVSATDDSSSTDSNDSTTQLGACCNQSTGDCYIANQCTSPYVWLGAGTSCSQCTVSTYTYDYGDAPASYPVLASQNGARHVVKAGVYLGQCVTKDKDGKPSPTATGDECDDGVEFTSSLVPGSSATARITASTNGVINAWIDFNRDGDWADAGEHVLTDEPVVEGTNIVTFLVPSNASSGVTFARFRFSTATGLSYTGAATDGEVEDYQVVIGDGGSNTTTYTAQSPSNAYYAKWSQPAKASGQAIQGWPEVSGDASGPVLADDWSDSDRRPIMGFRWWGSFDSWTSSAPPADVPSAFHICIWTNATSSASPATLVWETTSSAWTWAYSGLVQDPRGLASGQAAFEMCCMLSQDKWFYPTVAMGSRYWVSISAVYSDTTTLTHTWGMLTRQRNSGSGATRVLTVGSATSANQWPPQVGSVYLTGQSVVYPANVSWDLAFELISAKSGSSSNSSSLRGDLNGDGKVDSEDMAELINLMVGAQLFH